MTIPTRTVWSLKCCAAATLGVILVAMTSQGAAQQSDKEVVQLSPFVVSDEHDRGYQAANTLAGTRLKTPLKDIGSAVSVMTDVLFKDLGATDAASILAYGLSTEVSGVHGNFADGLGSNSQGTRAEQDLQRTNPQGSQRIRGLASASLTRAFFLTDIPFDSYNTDRIDISRGANSLLFGIGAPGGIINNSLLAAAVDGKNEAEVSVRLGERASHRKSFTYHHVAIKGRLAFRVAGLHDRENFQQRPAFETKRRGYGALESVLAKNTNSPILGRTLLRASFERGNSHGAPPNILPPTDAFSSFWALPEASLANVPGVVLPSYHPAAGPVENSRFHPAVGLTAWRPKLTIDNRIGVDDARVPTLAQRPFAVTVATIYPDPNSNVPSIPFRQFPQAQGFLGSSINGALELRNMGIGAPALVTNDFSFLMSQNFFGGNRQGQLIPNFINPVIMDTGVWDNENQMIQGLTNVRKTNFDAANVALEQTVMDGKGGVEVVYDYQTYRQYSTLPFSFGETIGDTGRGDVGIDISEYLPDGSPNPNLGRPFIKERGLPREDFRRTKREAYRATAFYELDLQKRRDRLGWLGRHVFTGMYSQQHITSWAENYLGRWESDDIDLAASPYLRQALSGGGRDVFSMVYLGPSVLGLDSPSEMQLSRVNFKLPHEGDSFESAIWNRDARRMEIFTATIDSLLVSGNVRKQSLDTGVLSWQGRFFNGNLVGLYGWRDDRSRTYENILPTNPQGILQRLPSGEINPGFIRLQDQVAAYDRGKTQTWSVVGHLPQSWLRRLPVTLSGHYSESENFQPSSTRRTIYGDVLPPPSGTTEEMGFTIATKDNRLTARFNWFETASVLASGEVDAGSYYSRMQSWMNDAIESSGAFPNVKDALTRAGASPATVARFNSYQDLFNEIISWVPERTQAIRNLRYDPVRNTPLSDPIPGQTATTDFVSKGFEIDLVANLTSRWRMALNVGQQESVRDNTARDVFAGAQEVLAKIRASPLANVAPRPAVNTGGSYIAQYEGQVIPPLMAVIARDGTLARELREWRANLVTNYEFGGEQLKGFAVGGAVRYQSRNAVGNPNVFLGNTGSVVPDVTRPFYGPAQTNGDLWCSYRRTFGKWNWKVQLNARNAFGDNDPIPVVINPDGKLAVVRNSNPREIFLTNTFSF